MYDVTLTTLQVVCYAVVENWCGNLKSSHGYHVAIKTVIGPDNWCQLSTEVPCSLLLCSKLAELINGMLVSTYHKG